MVVCKCGRIFNSQEKPTDFSNSFYLIAKPFLMLFGLNLYRICHVSLKFKFDLNLFSCLRPTICKWKQLHTLNIKTKSMSITFNMHLRKWCLYPSNLQFYSLLIFTTKKKYTSNRTSGERGSEWLKKSIKKLLMWKDCEFYWDIYVNDNRFQCIAYVFYKYHYSWLLCVG